MNIKAIFGNNIHAYRKLRNLSQEQLAERLDISIKHLSTLETGKVFASAELIETIALVLEVSVSALFYSPEEKSLDDSDISKIEKILDEESAKAVQNIKNRLHEESIHSWHQKICNLIFIVEGVIID